VNELPDSGFFEAWTFADSRVQIDMSKARDIWRDRMRNASERLLAALDVDYLRADEGGDELMRRDVMARKRELRDVTRDAAIERAETPDELKRCWPSCLGDRPAASSAPAVSALQSAQSVADACSPQLENEDQRHRSPGSGSHSGAFVESA
jgi:hypothetical protein